MGILRRLTNESSKIVANITPHYVAWYGSRHGVAFTGCNGTNSQGALNEKPRVIDGMKQPLADTAFWGGSKGSIKVTAYPVTDPDGNGGISLLIDTVQVSHAVYGGGGLDDFDEVPTTMSGGVDEALDDFGPATAPAQQAAPAQAELEDEIPF